MERYNIFNRVHKGLRVFLYDTGVMVQQTDFSIAAEAAQVIERIGEALYLFGQHALYVERLIFPFVIEFNPTIIASFRQQYQSNTVQMQRLSGLLIAYEHAVSTEEKDIAGLAVQKAFTGFLVTHLDSMAREDSMLNNLLWRNYNDAELLGLEKEVVAKLPAKDLTMLSKWIIRGMNDREIIAWLKAIEKTSVAFIFFTFFNTAEKELPESRWQRIQEVLAEGTLVK